MFIAADTRWSAIANGVFNILKWYIFLEVHIRRWHVFPELVTYNTWLCLPHSCLTLALEPRDHK